jgi:thioredoxin-like negative regulator of GroEL
MTAIRHRVVRPGRCNSVRLRRVLPAIIALTITGAVAQPNPPPPATPAGVTAQPDAVQALLQQASYWRTSHTDQALASLARVLAIDPDNADALAMQCQIQIEQNDLAGARASLTHLRTAHPQDVRLASLEQSLKSGPPDVKLVEAARQLARDGKKQEAVDTYRRAFNGQMPTPSYAAEYYLVLGSIEDQADAAREGLAKFVFADPNDLQLQLAYAKLLSYKEATRGDAVDRLAALAHQPDIGAEARLYWRTVLLWQGPDYRSQAQLQTYLAQNPPDAELLAKQEEYRGSLPDEGARDRQAGYQAYSDKQIPLAEQKFLAAVAFNPKDADSLIMLAIIRRSQRRFAEAKDYQEKAFAAAPDRRDEFVQAMGDNYHYTGPQGRGGGNGNGNRAVIEIYARIARLAKSGDYTGAETLLRRQMGRKPQVGDTVQLGYLQQGAGQTAEAEATFRRVLASNPRNVAALNGLAAVLASRGDTVEAQALYARAGNRASLQGLGQIQEVELRQQANDATDPAEKLRLFRAAIAANPADPWVKLEYARALNGQGQKDAAVQVMAGVANGPRPSMNEIQAALIWAQERNDMPREAQLISMVSAKQRTPQMIALQARAELNNEVTAALAAGSADTVQSRLLMIASHPDPTGARGVAVARALLRLHNRQEVPEALQLALNATQPPTAAQRLAYASMLSGAGLNGSADRLAQQIDPQQLISSDRTNYNALADGLAIQQADKLTAAGRPADAVKVLAPRLQADPDSAGVKLALSRAYQGQQKTREAKALTEAVAQQEPDDLDVRRAVVGTALQDGDMARARQLAAETAESAPDDPRALLIEADVARASGNPGRALAMLKRARALRQQQLSSAASQDDSAVQ